MASQSKVGNKTKQELLEYINKVRVVITDGGENCVHVYNDDNKGSSTTVMISDNEELRGLRMHCNDTLLAVALSEGFGGTGGYMIGNIDDFTKNQCQIVNLSYDVFAIFIANDNKVALGGWNGNVQFDQVDVNGKQTEIWCKKIHDKTVWDIKVHNDKIFTASDDYKCGVIKMSDGSVLHMFNAPNWLRCVCVVNDDVILTGCRDGKVYRHDMSTTTTSVFVTPGGSGYILTLALSNDYNILYCGGNDSTLYAFNMKTNNTLLWETKCENIISSICVQYGIIVVGVYESNVVCVNEHNGEIITTLTIKPQIGPEGIVMIPPSKAKIVAQSLISLDTPKALTTSTASTSTTTTTTTAQPSTVASGLASRVTYNEDVATTRNQPIFGLKAQAIVSLEAAVEKLSTSTSPQLGFDLIEVGAVWHAVNAAMEVTSLLTNDEAAAIHLYTMETPLYHELNVALRNADRNTIKPFFAYLKLLLSALYKLPVAHETWTIIYRGVKMALPATIKAGEKIMWWSITSTTKNIEVLKNDMYLGQTGNRVLFTIKALLPINIKAFSAIPNEDELILLPGTFFEVEGVLNAGNGLFFVTLTQCKSPIMLDFPHPQLKTILDKVFPK